MTIQFIKSVRRFKAGERYSMTDGVANVYIRRRLATEVLADPVTSKPKRTTTTKKRGQA